MNHDNDQLIDQMARAVFVYMGVFGDGSRHFVGSIEAARTLLSQPVAPAVNDDAKDTLSSAVESHCADLDRCVEVLREYPAWAPIASEFAKAALGLRATIANAKRSVKSALSWRPLMAAEHRIPPQRPAATSAGIQDVIEALDGLQKPIHKNSFNDDGGFSVRDCLGSFGLFRGALRQTAASATDQNERAAFEASLPMVGAPLTHVFSLTKHPNEPRYLKGDTELCWRTWRAAIAHRPAAEGAAQQESGAQDASIHPETRANTGFGVAPAANGKLVPDEGAAENYEWLRQRFIGYDYFWGEPPAVCAVFEVGEDFIGGRDITAAIRAAIAAQQQGPSHDRH